MVWLYYYDSIESTHHTTYIYDCLDIKVWLISDIYNTKMVVVTDLGPPEEGVKATLVDKTGILIASSKYRTFPSLIVFK